MEKDLDLTDELALTEDNKEVDKDNTLTLEEVQNTIINSIKNKDLIEYEINSAILDPKNDTFIAIIKDNVNFCVNELKEVDIAMNKINSQKGSELFFKKSENIKTLSQYMARVATVNQKTLDLLILLLGSSSKISEEYETILSTIDELGSLSNGETEVLNYLLKVKKMVFEIRDNDQKIQQLISDNNETKNIVNESQFKLIEEIKQSEKSRKILESKYVNLQRKIKFNNLYIGVCLLIIIALAIFVGVKLYV